LALSLTTKGVLACLGAAVFWASNGVVSKYLMNGGLPPLVLAQGRMTLAGLLTLGYLLLTRPDKLKLRRSDILPFILLGSLGMAAVNACYLGAIARIPTGAAILLEYLSVALVAVYAWAFMGERMRPLKLASLALACLGCYLVVGGYNLELLSLNRWGVLWGIGAAFCFGFYGVYSEYRLRDYGPWTLLCYALIVAAVCFNLLLGPEKLLTLGRNPTDWLLFLYSASLGTILPFGLFAYGIQNLRATRAMILAVFEPIAAGLIAFAWLGERMEGLQIIGGLAVVAAVVLIQRAREVDQLAPALLREKAQSLAEDKGA